MIRLAFAVRDDPETLHTWSQTITEFEKTKYMDGSTLIDRRYLPSGARHPNEPPFYCKITNQGNSGGTIGGSSGGGGTNGGGTSGGGSSSEGMLQQQSYIVPGEFLPNRLTPGNMPSFSCHHPILLSSQHTVHFFLSTITNTSINFHPLILLFLRSQCKPTFGCISMQNGEHSTGLSYSCTK